MSSITAFEQKERGRCEGVLDTMASLKRGHIETEACANRARGRATRAQPIIVIALTALACSAGTRAPAQEAKPAAVRLLPARVPQADFAGVFVAREKGFFARRGIELELLRGGLDRDPVRALEDGKADFAVLWLAAALEAIERGVPLVPVTQMFGASSLSIVAWRDRGISKIGDLEGRRVGVWADPLRPTFTAFFRSQKVAPVVVTQYSTVSLFLMRAVDACVVTGYDEYHALYLAGVDESELVRFPLRDYGFDFPEDGIYCLRKTRDLRPEVAKALAAGTLEGWHWAADHGEETLDLVLKHARTTNRTHLRRMLRDVVGPMFPAGSGPGAAAAATSRDPDSGTLSRAAYDATVRSLVDFGVLRGAPPYDEFVR